MTSDNLKTGLILAALAGAGYVAWKAYRTGAGIIAAAKQTAEQAAAEVQSTWNNTIAAPFEQGRRWAETGEVPFVSSKAFLYSDYGYTGNDANGDPIISGEWYGDAEARRYDIAQAANGTKPAATSINGAAFGIYPSSGIRRAELTDARQIDRIIERQAAAPGGSGYTGSW